MTSVIIFAVKASVLYGTQKRKSNTIKSQTAYDIIGLWLFQNLIESSHTRSGQKSGLTFFTRSWNPLYSFFSLAHILETRVNLPLKSI